MDNYNGNKSFVASKLKLRPFGSLLQDLETDFNENPLILITNLIRFCTITKNENLPDENFYWNLEVGKRIECLIKITLSDPTRDLTAILKCPENKCRKHLELTLTSNNLISDSISSIDSGDFYTLTIFDKNLRLRKPTGYDQLSWFDLDFTNPSDSIRSMISTLTKSQDNEQIAEIKPWSNEEIEYINDEMAKIDPMIDYKIELKCPICGLSNIHRLNLVRMLLKRLREIQADLLTIIHQIATNYHWTETDIIAIPDSRRRFNLSKILGEK